MKYIFCIVTTILLCAQTAFASNIAEAEEALREAEKADYAKAIQILEPVCKQFRATRGPGRTRQDMKFLAQLSETLSKRYIEASDDAFGKKDYKTAFSYAQKSVEVNPKNWEGYHNMGAVSFRKKQFKDAEEYYLKAIKVKPNELSYTALSEISLIEKKYKKAIRMTNEVIKINPRYARAYNNRGVAFYWLGKINAAREDYNRALRIEPNYDVAKDNLGRLP